MAHHYLQNFHHYNHKIIVNAFVTKILFYDDLIDKNIRKLENLKENFAYGIEYEKNDVIYQAFATKGIILSAGTIGSSKILLNSGIGPCNDLKNLSIKCRENLPVGKNLQDHITTGLDLIKLNTTAGLSITDFISPSNLFKFITYGQGPLTSIGCDILGFQKNINNLPPKLGFMIIPLGISTDFGMHLRYNFNINDNVWNEYFDELIGKQTISILPILLHPKSHGYIKLSTNNPKSIPIINPKYLTHKDDIDLLIQGIRYIQEFIKNPKLQKYGATINEKHFPGCNQYKFDTNEYWECYIKHLTLSVYHPVGTCKMGAYDNNQTVVLQNNFQVKNIENLYVVDASIMPNLPSGNPNSVVMMIARKFLKSLLNNKENNFKEKDNLNVRTRNNFHNYKKRNSEL